MVRRVMMVGLAAALSACAALSDPISPPPGGYEAIRLLQPVQLRSTITGVRNRVIPPGLVLANDRRDPSTGEALWCAEWLAAYTWEASPGTPCARIRDGRLVLPAALAGNLPAGSFERVRQ